MLIFWAVLGGFLLDALFGDPAWLPHPVVLMGRCISTLEKHLRTALPKTPRGELFACVVTDAYDTAIYTPERYPDDVGALLDYAAAQAVQQRDIGVTAQDRLVALSTCAGSETNGRVVVLGRLCPLKEGDEMQ